MPPEVVTAWKHYFTSKFEELNVVCFTSFPKDESERKRDPGKGTIYLDRTRSRVTLLSIGFFVSFTFQFLYAC